MSQSIPGRINSETHSPTLSGVYGGDPVTSVTTITTPSLAAASAAVASSDLREARSDQNRAEDPAAALQSSQNTASSQSVRTTANGSSQPTQTLDSHAPDSQESTMTTASSDRAYSAATGDTSPSAGGHPQGAGTGGEARNETHGTHQGDQLLQLSALAAAQDKMATDGGNGRKRRADGEVKPPGQSPSRGHSRNASAISVASTTSTIGELSAELRTRLSYAMVKVNNGWQDRSLGEVESLASQAASPTSSTSTIHRRQGSSASPRMAPIPNVHFAPEPLPRRRSDSPPFSKRPTLAPPASIQPSAVLPAPSMSSRRNSNPHYTPTLLSHSQSASPRTPRDLPKLHPLQATKSQGRPDITAYSPHQNVREQDAIETLLFMSSPGNSANLKHSPAGSPGPRSQSSRHALPNGPRKGLPGQRPGSQASTKKVGFEAASLMGPPDSPMDLDSPQSQTSPQKASSARKQNLNGGMHHWRSSISMAAALGGSNAARQALKDDDIERMLDRARQTTRDEEDSSDGEDIQIPRRNGVAAMST